MWIKMAPDSSKAVGLESRTGTLYKNGISPLGTLYSDTWLFSKLKPLSTKKIKNETVPDRTQEKEESQAVQNRTERPQGYENGNKMDALKLGVQRSNGI